MDILLCCSGNVLGNITDALKRVAKVESGGG